MGQPLGVEPCWIGEVVVSGQSEVVVGPSGGWIVQELLNVRSTGCNVPEERKQGEQAEIYEVVKSPQQTHVNVLVH